MNWQSRQTFCYEINVLKRLAERSTGYLTRTRRRYRISE